MIEIIIIIITMRYCLLQQIFPTICNKSIVRFATPAPFLFCDKQYMTAPRNDDFIYSILQNLCLMVNFFYKLIIDVWKVVQCFFVKEKSRT